MKTYPDEIEVARGLVPRNGDLRWTETHAVQLCHNRLSDETWWTNGVVAAVGSPPIDLSQASVSHKDVSKIFRNADNAAVALGTIELGDLICIVLQSGMTTTIVQAWMWAWFVDGFRDCVFYLGGSLDPVMVYQYHKLVGALMPVKPTDHVNKRIAEKFDLGGDFEI